MLLLTVVLGIKTARFLVVDQSDVAPTVPKMETDARETNVGSPAQGRQSSNRLIRTVFVLLLVLLTVGSFFGGAFVSAIVCLIGVSVWFIPYSALNLWMRIALTLFLLGVAASLAPDSLLRASV